VTFARANCACEVNGDRLVSLCGLHAAHLRQNVEAARAPKAGVDKELQRQLVVAIAPIVVSKVDLSNWRWDTVAEEIHNQVHEIMRRMD